MRQRTALMEESTIEAAVLGFGAKLPRLDHFDPADLQAPEGRPTHLHNAAETSEPAHPTFSDAVESMVEAIHAKDAYTRGHSRRVGFYAELIAREMGLPEDHIAEVRLGGQLHDAGKIGVPDAVLGKDGSLAQEEQARVREHPAIGEQILAPLLREHPTILAIVRWHHERFDGHGFPDGLGGALIPLGARIVAIADAFDAMITSRPYRPALPMTRAVRELVGEAGRQFDPECVLAFVLSLNRLLRRCADQAVVTRRLFAVHRGVRPFQWRQPGSPLSVPIAPHLRGEVSNLGLRRRSRGPPIRREVILQQFSMISL